MSDAGALGGGIIRERLSVTKTWWWAVTALMLGAGSWGVLWYPLRAFARAGLSGVWLAVMMFAGAALMGLLLCRIRGGCARPSRVWIALAVLGGITNIGFVVAVLHDDILRVTLLFYLSPVWSVLLARLFLREHLTKVVVVGVGTAVLGAFVLLWRHAGLALNGFDGLALGSGVSFAGANVLLRAHPDLSLESKVIATFGGVVLVGLLVLAVMGTTWPPVAMSLALSAVFWGGLCIFVITMLVQYGVTALPVRQSAVILLIEVLTAAFSQHLFLHQSLGPQAILGAVVIGIGAVLVGMYAP